MEREVNLPIGSEKQSSESAEAPLNPQAFRFKSSVPDIYRDVQAALKRRKTLSMPTSNTFRARRILVGQTDSTESALTNVGTEDSSNGRQVQAKGMDIAYTREKRDASPDSRSSEVENLQNKGIKHDILEQVSRTKEIAEERKEKLNVEDSSEVTSLTSPCTMETVTSQDENPGVLDSRNDGISLPIQGIIDYAQSGHRLADVHLSFTNSQPDSDKDGKNSVTGASRKLPSTVFDHGIPSIAMSAGGSKKVHFSVISETGKGGPSKASKECVELKQCSEPDPRFDDMQKAVRLTNFPTSCDEDRMNALISTYPGDFSQRADERMATNTGMENLTSYMNSLALTENGSTVTTQAGPSAIAGRDLKQQVLHSVEPRPVVDGLLPRRCTDPQTQPFMAFVGKEAINPFTLSSVAGSSCTSLSALVNTTATSVQCTSAPLASSTYHPCSYGKISDACIEVDQLEMHDGNRRAPIPAMKCANNEGNPLIKLASTCAHKASDIQEHIQAKVQSSLQKESVVAGDGAKASHVSFPGREVLQPKDAGTPKDTHTQLPHSKGSSSNVNTEPSHSNNPKKAASNKDSSGPRERHHNSHDFFEVNGKLYQKLGKIGSGGSSEVHKVITSDCTIYALKKIKLKGRDYATAYGFCQEIEYLNKLRGKKNIIQLIDYEVTDKVLFGEVMKGLTAIKDGRIVDDAYIYMVLEYGEIDLAHMLSQKWKEMDKSEMQMDENWLRFYWQQILKAVNTIHEERIVHSDLKPANFLLVKGSLKLIDFGIAKAIQSDTTHIQRDSQVGTLNYMSPEAFMCNEQDSKGNTIKCGRASDIWSLGCILYQMVYGKTPFADYKTFWAKFKVITDRNHKISYGPVSNPWLLDLMKKCLTWERSERWRIPQLLKHHFLSPPVPPHIPSSQDKQCKLIMQIAQDHESVPEIVKLCTQLQKLILNVDGNSKQLRN
ncbi:uncharacterized protein LOC18423230 isoform X2 [Amborella trichopoda]|uniref:uncharacterized protein LOC18423230 isoform X2 n=1 Tax=Amborella trichopoda TaxID=13333 RepID=UPI0009BE2B70|nr:uncharacterized protein LOC18423230 isoform X2 [Amborella trichopoda]|eukprot:XP_020528894.1 uncharacterized protein LOC18423230 isoform X2 [Amborella trichopoda]